MAESLLIAMQMPQLPHHHAIGNNSKNRIYAILYVHNAHKNSEYNLSKTVGWQMAVQLPRDRKISSFTKISEQKAGY